MVLVAVVCSVVGTSPCLYLVVQVAAITACACMGIPHGLASAGTFACVSCCGVPFFFFRVALFAWVVFSPCHSHTPCLSHGFLVLCVRGIGWHTRVTARLRQGGQTHRQGRQREGKWEGRRASERTRGCGTGVARRRAGGTRRARGSSGEREHGDTKKKKKKQNRRTHRKDT